MNHRNEAAIRFEPEEESTKISCLLKKTTGSQYSKSSGGDI